MFPAFTNAALLAGLAAVAAPILIHLLLRRKSQRLRFSTIQFFQKQDEQSMRKRKLRNLLLLAMRCLLFVLLVLAFARPFLRNTSAGADGQPRRQLVLLMDTSASMRARGATGEQWTRARELVRRELAALQADDLAALVSCSSRSEVVSEFAPAAQVLEKLNALEPDFGAASLEKGLRQARKVLARANPGWTTSVCIISDLQQTACDNLENSPLPREIELKTLDLGERFIPNLAVTALSLEADAAATVTSFSDENVSAPFTVKIDGQEMSEGTIHLEPGAVTNLPLALPALQPGWHAVEFLLEADDGLDADDVAYATIYISPPVHGLVVETRKTDRIFLEESYFVATALNPSRDSRPSISGFSFEKCNVEEVGQKLQAQPGRPEVEYVILPGLRTLPAGATAALREYVEEGGGLMLFLGDAAGAVTYAGFGDLLPAQLGRVETAGELEQSWHVANYDAASPIFAVFRQPDSGNVFLPEFTRRFRLRTVQDSTVVAEFEDGVPLIVAREFGKGRVMLVNTSADTAWTDWQKHKTFVPWLHATGRYLSGRNEESARSAPPAFISGVGTDFHGGAPATKLRLEDSNGSAAALAADEDGLVRDTSLARPGIYSLKTESGQEIQRIAANLASTESDLSNLAPGQFEQRLARSTDAAALAIAPGLFGDPSRGKEFWRVLLMAALGILVIEPILANRMLA